MKSKIGERFGRLLVVERISEKGEKRIFYKCLCSCGNHKTVDSTNLLGGHVKSCGCIRSEMHANKKPKLGRDLFLVEYNGEIVPLRDVCYDKAHYRKAYMRINRLGWSAQRAIDDGYAL